MKSMPASPGSKGSFSHIPANVDSGKSVLHAKCISTKELVARRGESFARLSWQEVARLLSADEAADDRAAASSHSAARPSSVISGGQAAAGGSPTSSSGSGVENRFDRASGPLSRAVGIHASYGASERASAPGGASAASGGPCIVTVAADSVGERAAEQTVLILDVRPADEFARCRLVESLSCPAVLARQDKWPRELLAFKYQEGKGILVVDARDDGDAGAIASRLLSTGQYPNVVVMTGGLVGGIAAALTQPTTGRVLGTTPSGSAAAARIAPAAFSMLGVLRGSEVAAFALGVAALQLPPHMQAFARRACLEARLDAAGRPDHGGAVAATGVGEPLSPSSTSPTVASTARFGGGGGGAAEPASAILGPSSLSRHFSNPAGPGSFGTAARMAGPIGGVSGGVAMGAKGSYAYR